MVSPWPRGFALLCDPALVRMGPRSAARLKPFDLGRELKIERLMREIHGAAARHYGFAGVEHEGSPR
jgi:hypothetical protein